MAYRAPSKLTPEGSELERALLVELRRVEAAITAAPANVRDPRGTVPARPQPGEFVRVADGQPVILPHPRPSRGQSVYLLLEGSATITAMSGLVNGEESLDVGLPGLVVAVSSGTAWSVVGVRIQEGHIAVGAVTTNKIADLAVTGAKLALNSVTASKVFKADTFAWTGAHSFASTLALSGTAFDTVIAATENNMAIGDVSVVTMRATGASSLTGMVAATTGHLVWLYNRDPADTISIQNQSASSSAANRFNCPSAAAFALAPNTGVLCYYAGSVGWYLFSR